MRRSCLIQTILLAVVIVVLSLAVRQAIVRGAQATAPAPTRTEPTPTLGLPAQAAVAPAPMTMPAAMPAAVLTLFSSRPVMLAEGYPVGLAAADGWLYLACQREPGQPGAFVARVALSDYGLVNQRDVSRAGEHRLGGMAAGGGSVWVVLQDVTVNDASLLLELDATTLDTRRTIAAAEALAAVAVAPDGALYVSRCEPGALLRLTNAGDVEQRVPSPEGVCYGDLAYVAGALVGVASNANVLDVLDPATLTLLARHMLPFTSARGNPVAGNAVAYDGAQFLFAPDRLPNPVIMAYRPRDEDLRNVIPLP
jgi:hypothetical protein